MKLLIHLKSLASRGGAERAVLGLAGELVKRGHDVSISVCKAKDSAHAYPIPEGVKLIWLRALPVPWYLRPLSQTSLLCQRALRELVAEQDYDVILGWLRYGASKVGKLPETIRAPRMSAMRNVPYGVEPPPLAKVKALVMYWLRRAGYARADKIFVQMPEFFDMLPPDWQAKAVVIPNAVVVPEFDLPVYGAREKLVIAVARLVEVKRHDALIRGFARFREQFPDWRLEIWGQDGPRAHRDLLDELIARHGLQHHVGLMGVTDDIEAVYARARIMAHPSMREGMSNSVAEAMARALPTLVCADCKGMETLITGGENGVMLKGDTTEKPLDIQIADALTELASNPERAEHLGRMARQSVEARFAPPVIYDQWERELFGPVAGHRQAADHAS